jgi:hypothetical protein
MTTEEEIKASPRGTRIETVVLADSWDRDQVDFGDGQDGSLDRVIASLQRIREEIPEEFRGVARCEIDSQGGYEGEHHATIKVCYSRPETDREWKLRIAQNLARLRQAQETDRSVYESLKARFEPEKP